MRIYNFPKALLIAMYIGLCSCNSDLPDIYALTGGPQARGWVHTLSGKSWGPMLQLLCNTFIAILTRMVGSIPQQIITNICYYSV